MSVKELVRCGDYLRPTAPGEPFPDSRQSNLLKSKK